LRNHTNVLSQPTRKMVNYAWIESSPGKLGWRLVEVLTRKSILEAGHSGERLIEPSSSWFPLKFPSGKRFVYLVPSCRANDGFVVFFNTRLLKLPRGVLWDETVGRFW